MRPPAMRINGLLPGKSVPIEKYPEIRVPMHKTVETRRRMRGIRPLSRLARIENLDITW
jgi:hypothetical protein